MSHAKHLSSFDLGTLDIEGGSSSTLSSDSNYFEGLPILAALRRAETAKDIQYWTSRGPQSVANTFEESGGSKGLIANVKTVCGWVRDGLADSVRFKEVAGVVSASPAIRLSIAKGLVLSVAVVLLVFFFELAFFPAQLYLRHTVDEDEQALLGNGNVLWLYPVIAISYFIASSWTLDVAQTAYKLRHNHLRGLSLANISSTATSQSLRRRICQESVRVLLILNYIAIVLALQRLPYSSWLGRVASFLFMSFVDAYYCFDPVLTSRGWTVEKKMRFVEEKWAYMTAFGILPTLVSFFHPSGLLNLFLFMLVYPFYTVLALMANPQPRGSNSSAGPFIPQRLPFFFPTAVLYRWIMRLAPPARDDDGPLGYGGISRSSSASYLDKKATRPTWATYHGGGGGDGVGVGVGSIPHGYLNGAANGGVPGRKTAAQFVGGAWGSNQNASTNGTGAMRWGPTPPPSSPQLGGGNAANGFSNGYYGNSSHTGVGSLPTPTSAQAQELTIPTSYSHVTQLNPVNAGRTAAAVGGSGGSDSAVTSAASTVPLTSPPPPPPPMGNGRRNVGKKTD